MRFNFKISNKFVECVVYGGFRDFPASGYERQAPIEESHLWFVQILCREVYCGGAAYGSMRVVLRGYVVVMEVVVMTLVVVATAPVVVAVLVTSGWEVVASSGWEEEGKDPTVGRPSRATM